MSIFFQCPLFKMEPHSFTYIFALGTIFAMLDAYNNGASELSNVVNVV